jgi:hypothetical protein
VAEIVPPLVEGSIGAEVEGPPAHLRQLFRPAPPGTFTAKPSRCAVLLAGV